MAVEPLWSAVARMLSQASSASVLSEVLRVIAVRNGWDFGALWARTPGSGQDHFQCLARWGRLEAEHALEPDPGASLLNPGEGLPGKVVQQAQPVWVESLAAAPFSCGNAVKASGMRSAHAFPLLVDGAAVGAVEFFSSEPRAMDAQALLEAGLLGSLLGQFVERQRLQGALRESEDRLSLALDAGHLGTWEWDVRTNELRWSETLQRLHGLEPSAFPGNINAFLNDMHPEDREPVLASVRNALAGSGDHQVEYRIVRPDGSQRWVLGIGKVIRDDAGAPLRMRGICMDITERKQSELSMKFLAEASTILAASLDYQTTLAAVARLAVPGFADWCAVDLAGEGGTLKRLAVAHSDPEKVRFAYELQERYPPDPNAPHGVHQIIRSGQPELMAEIPMELLEASIGDEEHLAIVRSLGLRSYIGAPLVARDRVLGAITLVNAESGRTFGEEDLALAQELARRAAVAIDNARLFQETEQAEQQLRERLEFIHAVTHSLEDGIAALDGRGRITFVNPAAEAMLGYASGELVGQVAAEVLRQGVAHGAESIPHPATLLEEKTVRVHQEGETLLRRDGTSFPVAYTCAPLRTGEMDPGAVLLFRDVTQARLEDETLTRRAREAAMVADVGLALNHPGTLHELLTGCTEAVVRHVGAAFARVWTLNSEQQMLELEASSGLYTHINGGHARVPVGAFKIGLIAQERRAHLTNHVASDPRVGDPEWARSNGMVSFAGYPLLVEDRLVGVLALFARHPLAEDTLSALGAIADIVAQGIERKRGEERLNRLNTSLERRVRERTAALMEVNKELESFSYSVSHDLRAPLRHVLGFADMLEKRSAKLLDENSRRYLRTIQESARHAGSLVDDLLAFSRMGRAEMRQQRVAMQTLVQQVVQEILPETESPTVTWSVAALPEIQGDAAMLRLVWRNLLSNAVKYTRGREQPEIRVTADTTADEVIFTVRDNGVGFDMPYVDKLFGVFQRLHSNDEFEGTGIGLANVRRIVQRHGGRTWAEGEVDGGAAFHFTLPHHPQLAEPPKPGE